MSKAKIVIEFDSIDSANDKIDEIHQLLMRRNPLDEPFAYIEVEPTKKVIANEMKTITFEENDSTSQLYYCSDGGNAGGEYYKSPDVITATNKLKKENKIIRDALRELLQQIECADGTAQLDIADARAVLDT